MSISTYNGRYNQSFEGSIDVQDLKNRNRHLQQENDILKEQLQQLIKINFQLTSSIQEFNQSQQQQKPNINQQEIQALAHQVIELQQELQVEKIKSKNLQPDSDVGDTLQVIQQLANTLQNTQQECQIKVDKLQQQLTSQKQEAQRVIGVTQQKLNKTISEYQNLSTELKRKDQIIRQLQSRVLDSQNPGKKELKASSTIQDLRDAFQRQIEQKSSIIKIYQQLIVNLRGKIQSSIQVK